MVVNYIHVVCVYNHVFTWYVLITKRIPKREKKLLKKDSEKKNISETVIRKKILVKTVIRKNISERMLKTMKKPNAPREGCFCKGKTPKTFS